MSEQGVRAAREALGRVLASPVSPDGMPDPEEGPLHPIGQPDDHPQALPWGDPFPWTDPGQDEDPDERRLAGHRASTSPRW